jgi:hypothetical protein
LSEAEKSSVPEMIGEALREVGILTLVFVPLEAYRGVQWKTWVVALAMMVTVILAIGFLALGIAIERKRELH